MQQTATCFERFFANEYKENHSSTGIRKKSDICNNDLTSQPAEPKEKARQKPVEEKWKMWIPQIR